MRCVISEHVRLRTECSTTGDMKGAQLSVVGPLNTRAECTVTLRMRVLHRNQRIRGQPDAHRG